MGNYISSCSLGIVPKIRTNKAARVIFPTGEIRQFQDSIKAAEIMLDCPNFFVVNSRLLTINRRFFPISADEDLEPGNVYIMFPMRRLNSMVTPGDMAVFWLSANSAPKRISGRISPDSALGDDVTAMVLNEAYPPRLVVDVPEYGHRLVVSRSKKPVLATITEEPREKRDEGVSALMWCDLRHLSNSNSCVSLPSLVATLITLSGFELKSVNGGDDI